MRDKAVIRSYDAGYSIKYMVLAPAPNSLISSKVDGFKTIQEAVEYCERHKWEVNQDILRSEIEASKSLGAKRVEKKSKW